MRYTTVLTVLLGLLLSVLLAQITSRAATRLTNDLTELLSMAQAVVEIEVLDLRVQPHSVAAVPLTVVTLKARKVYKGDLAVNTCLIAEYFGGFDGSQKVVVCGQPELKAGERAVLLLSKKDQSSNWRILGGDVGQINLSAGSGGQIVARRGSGRFDYFVASAQSLTGYAAASNLSVSGEFLEVLLTTTINTGRPVLEAGAPADATPPVSVPQSVLPVYVPAPAAPAPPPVLGRVLMVLGLMTVGYLLLRRWW